MACLRISMLVNEAAYGCLAAFVSGAHKFKMGPNSVTVD